MKCKDCGSKEVERDPINIGFVIFLTLIVLLIGILGYYTFNEQDWTTAFYDAASVMSVVGAGDEPHTVSGKIFGGIYSLAVGLGYAVFIAYIITSVLNNQ